MHGMLRGVVAVDGPSGTGKSTTARGLAMRLDARYLDTGAMYRAATWSCVDAGISLTDEGAVAAHVESMDLRMGTDPEAPTVQVGTVDVAHEIRSTRISASTSSPSRRTRGSAGSVESSSRAPRATATTSSLPSEAAFAASTGTPERSTASVAARYIAPVSR